MSGHAAGQKNSDNAKVKAENLNRLRTLIMHSLQVNDLEWQGVGTYDDTVLNQIDQLMVRHSPSFIRLHLKQTP